MKLIAFLVAMTLPAVPHPHKPHRRRHRHTKPMHTAVASYYDDAGATASGWHARYGVAHRTLAFGTRIRLCYKRCVTALVDDRGPYVAGRTFDLDYATMYAIGFPAARGVATVRYAIR